MGPYFHKTHIIVIERQFLTSDRNHKVFMKMLIKVRTRDAQIWIGRSGYREIGADFKRSESGEKYRETPCLDIFKKKADELYFYLICFDTMLHQVKKEAWIEWILLFKF